MAVFSSLSFFSLPPVRIVHVGFLCAPVIAYILWGVSSKIAFMKMHLRKDFLCSLFVLNVTSHIPLVVFNRCRHTRVYPR